MIYQTINQNCVRYVGGNSFPTSDGNADYEEYKRWLALGNTPLAADPPPPPSAKEIKNATDLATAKANAQLVTLSNMTAVQITNYVNNNSTADPETKKILILLAIGLSIELRDKLE